MKKVFAFLLLAALLLTLGACVQAPVAANADETPDWQTQYDLGVRYLSEGNYEAAILAFNAAIEIDPKNPDAYIKLAEVYEQTGDDEAALRTLLDGAQNTGSDELTARAEEMQKALETPAEPAEPETPAEPEASEPPDWPARLAGIGYLGDVTNCRMSAEAAEAYAAVLEQLPETKTDDWGIPYTLCAALLDPGDGYPLLLTGYIGPEGSGFDEIARSFFGETVCQAWGYDGTAATVYDFSNDVQMTYSTDIDFGTLDGRPGICVYESDGATGPDQQRGWVYYTVSEYRILPQHHLKQSVDYNAQWTDEYGSTTVQEYLDMGWETVREDEFACTMARYEVDGTQTSGEAYRTIAVQFQADPALDFYASAEIGGYWLDGWNDASVLCAALRGQ